MYDSQSHGGNALNSAVQRNTGYHTACMQESALGNEEEQLVSLLLSKGAAESALADEMGRLKVQEEVRILRHHPHTIYAYITHVLIYNCEALMTVLFTREDFIQQHVCS